MFCKIAQLGVEIPEIGNLPQRCKEYIFDIKPNIIISEDEVTKNPYKSISLSDSYYMRSGFCFYRQLLKFNGFMLHSSAVVVDGKAYLFSGPCGIGKSTHTGLYLNNFGDRAFILNDDKPALRLIDNKWFAFGTPWSGKNGINKNASAPLAGICFLHRGDNSIKRLSPLDAFALIYKQSYGTSFLQQALLLTQHINDLISKVPVFEFFNHAKQGDELITYNAINTANN